MDGLLAHHRCGCYNIRQVVHRTKLSAVSSYVVTIALVSNRRLSVAMKKPAHRTSNATHAERVLEALRKAQRPISAYEIIASIRTDREMAPATVYRALDRLIRERHVHKLQSLNAYVSCRHNHCCDRPAFAICDRCGVVNEFSACGLGSLLDQSCQAKSFALETVTIELHGTCHACQNRQEN
ncbi:Fur family transcriptional regulator [Hyphomicrobium sulfonivorans]|uniref:Fur family transcriptional regulator n=1 Tax=Hyphomicrobium sulfonivorans TaxID=121290 RepID=UPI0015712BFD|nr:transcriptional repressor [Hyphomicrobium sulfonivorans]MBI1649146.1 transcriptional repressor [Hyphomicrobium sulfonivorans]NSL70323.1 transcriptional repressor [Hyphomicrobium sulfonivorans]